MDQEFVVSDKARRQSVDQGVVNRALDLATKWQDEANAFLEGSGKKVSN